MSEKADIYHSEKAGTTHIDYSDEKNLAITGSEQDLGHFIADAADAAQQQKTQSTRGAFAMWKPAVLWSIIFSSAIIMEGYDTILLVSWLWPHLKHKLISLRCRVNSGRSLHSLKSMEPSTRNPAPTKSPLDGKLVCLVPCKWETSSVFKSPVRSRKDSVIDSPCSSPSSP
jgi:hypothetical protein